MSEIVADKLSNMIRTSLTDYPIYLMQWVEDGHIESAWSKRETLIKIYGSLDFRLGGKSGENYSNYLIPKGTTDEEFKQGKYYKIIEVQLDHVTEVA